MIDNQKSRRNLTDGWKFKLLETKRQILLEQGKESQGRRTDILSDSDKKLDIPKHNTQKIIAKDLGWSTGKVAKADFVFKNADKETEQAVLSGDKSIDGAYHEVKKNVSSVKIQQKRQEIARAGQQAKPSDRWNIYCGDIALWQTDKQYDFIITDPPYPKEYLPLWETLARRSKQWLKDGGLLIAMSGQTYLNKIYSMLGEHLDYYWTACYLTPGQPTPMRTVNVNTTWKPLLIFGKGKYTGKIFGDVFTSDKNEKQHHKWGQSESGMIDIVSKICLEGQSILDPFCGAGTTGVAALRHGCFFDGLDIDIDNVNISKGRLNGTK
jgi:site-specific DNA-methyltransferase (adenine-specific)